jgi:hypothetical protein
MSTLVDALPVSSQNEEPTMSTKSDLNARLLKLADRYYHSLEDQLYDPNPEVDGYDKERQQQYVLGLLRDLARDAANLALGSDPGDA